MNENPPTLEQRLTTIRIIWAAMLMGEVLFLLIVLWLIQQPGTPADPNVTRLLFFIGLGLLVTAVPMGYFIRAKVYEQGRQQDDTVNPAQYTTGNIILLAMCEGPAFLALVNILLSRQLVPSIVIVVIALAVQAINFPTGAPLRRL